MIEATRPEQEPQPEPFEIRAHHLQSLLNYQWVGEDRYINDLLSSSSMHDNDKTDTTYHVDVFGTTTTERNNAVAGMTDFLSTFWKLDPDHEVKIVTKRLDGICKSCVLGNHCNVDLNSDPAEGETEPFITLDNDSEYMSRFIQTALKLKLDDAFAKTSEPTERISGLVAESQVIATDARTVKRVIQDHHFSNPKFNIVIGPRQRQLQEKITPKAKRNAQQAEWRDNFDSESEYTRALFMHRLSRLRPLVGAYLLYAAGSTIFNAGQAVQSFETSQDVQSVTTQQHLNHEGGQEADDVLTGTLKAVGAGAIFMAFPRRRRTLDNLNTPRARVSAKDTSL